ncbi:MAG: methylmalonyl-CoA mutase, partial [Eudoraea sp.]|nr:methylmalonyl-CoA mutase [Eudoraea sp.]
MMTTKLFAEFQDISPKGWKQKIQFDLKGTDYNEALIWNAPEGIQVKPFYHRDDLSDGGVNIYQPEKWRIGQLIEVKDAVSANLKARKALDSGTESLSFIIPSEKIKVQKLLQGIDLPLIPLYFSFQFFSPSYIKELLEIPGITSQNTYLNTDIIGHLARTGNWHRNSEEDHSGLLAIRSAHPDFNTISVDMSLYQNAGANIVQQLAYGMAHANEYLDFFERKAEGLSGKSGLTFRVSVGGNYFFEIAKLRALRLLWQSLAKEYNVSPDCHIVASPSLRNKTIYDYNTNMIRTTMENMAAVLGGANIINPLSYDAVYNKENEFGERIARNQLLILKFESHLDKVHNA